MAMLFFVGMIEMLILTVWTKLVTGKQIALSGVITFINVLIWYYVIQSIVNNINNINLIILYAIGCALGTTLGMFYYERRDKKSQAMSKQKLIN